MPRLAYWFLIVAVTNHKLSGLNDRIYSPTVLDIRPKYTVINPKAIPTPMRKSFPPRKSVPRSSQALEFRCLQSYGCTTWLLPQRAFASSSSLSNSDFWPSLRYVVIHLDNHSCFSQITYLNDILCHFKATFIILSYKVHRFWGLGHECLVLEATIQPI